MSSEETIRFGYASSKNISFRGEVDTGITREDWAEMSDAEKDEAVNEAVAELVEVWVVGE
jgi:hypothetical protein